MTTETNAEFLERMKRKAYTKMIYLAVQVDMPDLKRLVQQAERAQELEIQKPRRWQNNIIESHIRIEKENARLRKALEDIAEETGTPCGRIAKAALKGESE